MRVTYRKPPRKSDPNGEEVSVECQSAYLRDGALIIVSLRDGQVSERGIPLARLEEWEILRERRSPKPSQDAPSVFREARDAYLPRDAVNWKGPTT